MRQLSFLFSLFICLSLWITQSMAESSYSKQKIVYHINYDDPSKQVSALRNIQNQINAVGADNLKLEVVLHGDGLSLLLEPEALPRLPKFKHANANQDITARVDDLKGQGVNFLVGANTIRRRQINVDTDLYNVEPEDIVPNGIVELVRLQSQGYIYIKP